MLRNEQAGRGHRPRLSNVWENILSGALRSQCIARAGNSDASVRYLAHSAQMFSCERIPAAGVAGAESPELQSSFSLLLGFPAAAIGRCAC